jgi:hypothetical protein
MENTKLDVSSISSETPTHNLVMVHKYWKGGYTIEEYDGEKLMACSTIDEVCDFLKKVMR